MRAELIIDIHDLGNEVGKALGRDATVFPSLGTVAELWRNLGLEVSAMHIVAPAGNSSSETNADFLDLHTNAWWKTEQAFMGDQDFGVSMALYPRGQEGPIAVDELVTTLALSRSDALAAAEESAVVIVMSNSADVAPAVTFARGVPVQIAGTVIHDSGLAHTRLELSWMGMLKDRFAAINLTDIEIRNGRPWQGDIAVSTPLSGTEGRDLTTAIRPSFAESVAVFDPDYFEVGKGVETTSPRDAGLAAVVHTLGLGALLHVEDVSVDAQNPVAIAAATYRFAADSPDSPLVIASARPSMIALTSDPDTFAIPNPERILRLCLPDRDASFDEAAYAKRTAITRIVIEQTLNEPLFLDDEPALDLDVENPSPTLTLHTNPNTIREMSTEWRQKNKRRFLLLGATGAEATPAEARDGVFLPISLGGCTDFTVRRPALRPGCIVEGVLHSDGGRWVIVSDPIERRRRRRVKNPVQTPLHAVDSDVVAAA